MKKTGFCIFQLEFQKKGCVIRMFKKIAGVFCLILGIFFSIATIKMIFIDNPKTKSVLKDAVYVGEDAIDEKNDG